MRVIILYLTTLIISSCFHESNSESNKVFVYDTRERVQCQSNYSVKNSRNLLTKSEIEVSSSTCGQRTGVGSCSACDICPTLDFVAHKINKSDIKYAKDIGFDNVNELVDDDRGVSYQFVDCEDLGSF